MTFDLALFWLLLPLAAASGWWIARREHAGLHGDQVKELRSSYFRGLNYLLNEQQDKALEVFLRLAESDEETVETQLALGSLFRRRGEVDRAIRVHQNLIARPDLPPVQKTLALVALGEDYMRAGLLDRAEVLFTDLVGAGAQTPAALRQLLTIYQQERDWPKAIEQAQCLELASGESQRALVAQLNCEMVEQTRTATDASLAPRYLEAALAADPGCTRAWLLRGDFAQLRGEFGAALSAFAHAVDLDAEIVPEVLAPLIACLDALGDADRKQRCLEGLTESYRGITPVLELVRLLRERHGIDAAIERLIKALRERPSVRGLLLLTELLAARGDAETARQLQIVGGVTQRMIENRSNYRCSRCGFSARQLHWHCPSCRTWGSARPIHGVMGD
ncbi:MAG: lipopolysaccharide assembly protein LapB [Lysobacterales bacterium]